MKIIFLGTPDFAVVVLESLIKSHHEILAVVTQPDKMRDRCKITYSPVKEYALKHGIKVLQYEKISRDGVDDLRALNPDVLITAAYGQILSEEILNLAPNGVLNVHASLLPKYRGSAPIQWAIINGENETGVTIMKTAYKVDSGDILLQVKTPIGNDETAGELFDRLSVLGGEALLEALEIIENGKAMFVPQNHSEMTYFPMLKKENGKIDFNKSAFEIKCLVQGVSPWPSAYTFLNGKMLKIHKVSVADEQGKAGSVINADLKNGLVIACGKNAIKVEILQPENSKKMTAYDYLLGHKIEIGTILGD